MVETTTEPQNSICELCAANDFMYRKDGKCLYGVMSVRPYLAECIKKEEVNGNESI